MVIQHFFKKVLIIVGTYVRWATGTIILRIKGKDICRTRQPFRYVAIQYTQQGFPC
jgi:hypothetical protein